MENLYIGKNFINYMIKNNINPEFTNYANSKSILLTKKVLDDLKEKNINIDDLIDIKNKYLSVRKDLRMERNRIYSNNFYKENENYRLSKKEKYIIKNKEKIKAKYDEFIKFMDKINEENKNRLIESQ